MISGIMCVYEEEKMAPYAIRSVADYIDELIVINKPSTDKTEYVIKETCRDAGLPLHFEDSYLRLRQARLYAFKKARYDWCLIVDGDEVFHTEGPAGAHKLNEIIECGISCYRAPMNYLYLDTKHGKRSQPQKAKHRFLYPNDDNVKPRGLRDLPDYDGTIFELNDVFKFNCGIKSPERMYKRQWWYDWSKLYDGPLTFDEWITENRVYPSKEDMELELRASAVPYDEKEWGVIPKMLRNSKISFNS